MRVSYFEFERFTVEIAGVGTVSKDKPVVPDRLTDPSLFSKSYSTTLPSLLAMLNGERTTDCSAETRNIDPANTLYCIPITNNEALV